MYESINLTIDGTQPSKIIEIHELTDDEIKMHLFIPHILLGPENYTFNVKIIEECNRVATLVLKYLHVPTEKFVSPTLPLDLVDSTVLNENDLHTFPRTKKGTENIDIPVIIYCINTVCDSAGNIAIAIYSPQNNVIYISLTEAYRQFTNDHTIKSAISGSGDVILDEKVLDHPEIMSAIAVIEEMIHFVQIRDMDIFQVTETSSVQSIEEHDANTIEAQARPIKMALIRRIYPEYVISDFTASHVSQPKNET